MQTIFIFENLNATTLYDDYKVSHINIGCGNDLSIKDLAQKFQISLDKWKNKI